MPVSINGNGTISGVIVGGLPDGIVDADMLASNAVTSGKLASGVGGKVLQYKLTKKNDSASTSDSSTAGVEISSDFRITLIPTSATSIIYCQAFLSATVVSTATANYKIYRNTASDFSGSSTLIMPPSNISANTDGNMNFYADSGGFMAGLSVTAFETAGNTTARTYSPFWSTQTNTIYINKWSSSAYYSTSTFTVMEVAA